MTRRESLNYLYGLQTFGIKLGLDNIQTLLARLDSPADSYRTVLVAGTNGKGSTASTLAEVLRQSGVRTGLYTSPHLHCFTERIRIDGEPVDFDFLEPLIEELRQTGSDLPLTFFEFSTALALESFRRCQVEVAILEVGMGGRLDATNAISPSLGVITPIALDHQVHLGATLEAIALEKAGIMRKGVPVVLSHQQPEALESLKAAAEKIGAEPVVAGVDFTFNADGKQMSYIGLDSRINSLQPSLVGAHQQSNMSVALAAAEILRQQGVVLDDSSMIAGVASTVWPGRLEWYNLEQQILLDAAHNGAGADALAAYLETTGCRRVRWLLGMKSDKAMLQIIRPVLKYVATVYCVEPPVEEAQSVSELTRVTTAFGVPAIEFSSIEEGLKAARSDCEENEIVLVAGSLFLVAAVRELLEQEKPAVA